MQVPWGKRSSRPVPAEATATSQLVAAYHQAARAEIVQRVGYRDTAMFLFLGSAVTIFGVALAKAEQTSILYAIPVLGLGAAYAYAQHSRVIGTIGRYLAIELDASAKGMLGRASVPVQWDHSESLLGQRGHNLPVIISASSLLVVSQILALVFVGLARGVSPLDVAGLIVGAAAVAATLAILVSSHRLRMSFHREIKKYMDQQAASLSPNGRPACRKHSDVVVKVR